MHCSLGLFPGFTLCWLPLLSYFSRNVYNSILWHKLTQRFFDPHHPEYKLHCGFMPLFQYNFCIKHCVHCIANIVNHHPSPDSTVNYFNDHSIVGEKIEILQKMCKCGTWIDLMVGSAANVDQTSTCCCWLVVRLSSDDRPKSLTENRLKVKVVRLSWQGWTHAGCITMI